MTDINEKETMQYFMNGLKRSRSAAIELGDGGKKQVWGGIVTHLDQLHKTALKLATGRPQTRAQTLKLASVIQEDAEKKTDTIIH